MNENTLNFIMSQSHDDAVTHMAKTMIVFEIESNTRPSCNFYIQQAMIAMRGGLSKEKTIELKSIIKEGFNFKNQLRDIVKTETAKRNKPKAIFFNG